MTEISPTEITSTISSLTREFDLVAHNLANVSTIGYKRRINNFSKSLIAQQAADQDPEKTDLTTAFDFSQGSLTETGNSLDFALCGKGFFVIETPDGPLYTRNGMFRLDRNGQIVDSSGRIVSGQSGPITIPPNVGLHEISVSSDGNVSGAGLPIGKLKLVDFEEDEGKLFAAGMSCFAAPDDLKPKEAERLIVKQAFQEGSNVQMVEELVDMITVTRLYEANMKFLSSEKDTTSHLIDVAMS